MLVCLGCSDLGIGLIGADRNQPTIGLTSIGADSLLSLLVETFPNDPSLQALALQQGYSKK